MSLITPDFGLLFWMVVIFGLVFFILAKFGFPIITNAVQKRVRNVTNGKAGLQILRCSQRRVLSSLIPTASSINGCAICATPRVLKEASQARESIIAQAKEEAAAEAAKLLEHAKVEIAAEHESAIRDIRRQVAMISVEVAEKIVRKELDAGSGQQDLLDRLVEEASQAQIPN